MPALLKRTSTPPKRLDGEPDHPLDVGAFAHVHRDRYRCAATHFNLLGNLGNFAEGSAGDDYLSPSPSEGEAARPANAGAAPGDDGRLAGQV